MDNHTSKRSRRKFVQSGVAVAFGLPVIASLTRMASAAELPRLDLNDPTAKALKYVHDATTVDEATRGGADRICASCRFYTGEAGPEWGPCTLFPGKSVNANGWCASWIARG